MSVIGNNVSVITRLADKKELDSIKNAQKADLTDNVVDATKEGAETLREDLKGAVNSGKDLFLKTEKGIIKIDKKDMAATIAQLKEKVESKEKFSMIKIGFMEGAFVAQFKPADDTVKFNVKPKNTEQEQPEQEVEEKQPENKEQKQPETVSKLTRPTSLSQIAKDGGVKAEYQRTTQSDDGVNSKKTEINAKVENTDISASYKSQQLTKGGDDKTKMGKTTEASYKGGVVTGSQTKTFTGKVESESGEVEVDESSTNSVTVDANKKEVSGKHEDKKTVTQGETKTTTINKGDVKATKDGVTGEVSRSVNTNDGVNDKTTEGKVVIDGDKSKAELSTKNNIQGGNKETFWNQEAKGSVDKNGATYNSKEHFKGKVESESGEVEKEEKKTTDAKVDFKGQKAEVKTQKETTITNGDNKSNSVSTNTANIDASKKEASAKHDSKTVVTNSEGTTTTTNKAGITANKDGITGDASRTVNTNDGVTNKTTEGKLVIDGDKSKVEISQKKDIQGGDKETFWNQEAKGYVDKNGAVYNAKEHFKGKVEVEPGKEVVKEEKKTTDAKVDFKEHKAEAKKQTETTITDGDTKTVTKQNLQGSIGKDGVKGELSQSKNVNDGVNDKTDDKKLIIDGAKTRVEIVDKQNTEGGTKDTNWNREGKTVIDKSGVTRTKTETFNGKVQDPNTLQEVNKSEKNETTTKADWTKGEASRTSKSEVETKDADGKSTKTVSTSSASVNAADGTAQASKNYEKTNADGTKSTAEGSVKGKIVDGEKSAGAQGSVGKGNVKVGVSGDFTITATKPKQNPDGTWSVTWTRQLTAKLSVSKDKLEAGVSSEGAEKIDKKFKTLEEAEKFYKSPPVSLESSAGSMQVGESDAKSNKTGVTLGRAATDTPIGKIGGKFGLSDGRSVILARKDEKTFLVDISTNKSLTAGLTGEYKGIGAGANVLSEKGKALKFTIDISTPEGKTLINTISKDKKAFDELLKKIENNPGSPPKGIKILSEEDKSKKAVDGKVSIKAPIIAGITVGGSIAIGKEVTATVKRADNDAFEIDLQKKNSIAGSGTVEKGPVKGELNASKKEAQGLGINIDGKSENGKRLIALIRKDAEKGMTEILDYMKTHKGQVPQGVKLTSKSDEMTKEVMASLGLGSYAKFSAGSTQNSSSQKTVDKDGNVTDVNSGGSGESMSAEVMGRSVGFNLTQDMQMKQVNGILKEAVATFNVNSSNDIVSNKQLAHNLGVPYSVYQKDLATETRKWQVKVSFTKDQIYDIARQILMGQGPNRFGNSDALAALEKNVRANKNDPVEVAKAFSNFMKTAPAADMRAIYMLLEKTCGYKKSDYNIEMTVTGKKGSVSFASGENSMGKVKSAVAQYAKDRKSDNPEVRAAANMTKYNMIQNKERLIEQLSEPSTYFNELPLDTVDLMKKQAQAELKYMKEHMNG